jgi:predicted pyridoxine 5'-phosphate oxidase superfamily flavin-nucleotide-binding protein
MIMAKLTERVCRAWDNKEDKLVFATVDSGGNPNVVWVSCVRRLDDERLLIVNNYFHKTLENALSGSIGSLLFIAPEREAYQIKGTLSYHTDDDVYKDMKAWLDPKFAGVGAIVLTVTEIYFGAEKIV